MSKDILLVFGTRPEALKLVPVIKQLINKKVSYKICITGQHKEIINDVLGFYKIEPDYNLNIMKESQDLFDITTRVLTALRTIFSAYKPGITVVHGDTSTSFAACLASFYYGIKVAHVEAGLRTGIKTSPFPEEINRKLISNIADIHFAPTINARDNLIKENVLPELITVTGNTIIDTVNLTKNELSYRKLSPTIRATLKEHEPFILVTAHRRENFGKGIVSIIKALIKIANKFPDYKILYPVHPNPNINLPVKEKIKGSVKNIVLLEPLNYFDFLTLMKLSTFILTDSGGVQEEASVLHKRVVLMRDTTERPEGVEAGFISLVGTDTNKIVNLATNIIQNELPEIDWSINPFGEGKAGKKIVDKLLQELHD